MPAERPRLADRKHGPLIYFVDDIGRRQIEREHGREQTAISARHPQRYRARPFATGEQQKT